MKRQHFFYVGLGVLLLALLVACGQAPIAEPETGQQAAPAEVVAPQIEATTGSISSTAQDEPGALAWPPRPTQFPSAEDAELSLDENALAEYHQSERDFTSIVPSRIEENALDVYHQSEWGRAPSPILPIIENRAEANGDIGLMEFFVAPNETSQQHTEPGTLEARPHIDPADRKFFSPGYGAQTISDTGSEAILSLPDNEIGE